MWLAGAAGFIILTNSLFLRYIPKYLSGETNKKTNYLLGLAGTKGRKLVSFADVSATDARQWSRLSRLKAALRYRLRPEC